MTKRRLIRWSLLLAILAAFAVWLEPTRVVWGWLRGEAFYQGRPTSWWRQELERWDYTQAMLSNGHTAEFIGKRQWYRQKEFLEQHFPRLFTANRTEPPLLDGDAAAKEVLLEMLRQPYEDSNWVSFQDGPMFRAIAIEALQKIEGK